MRASTQQRTRRSIDVSTQQFPRKTINRSALENSCYRLSKTTPIGQQKGLSSDKSEPYSKRYFSEHEDEADDVRDPEEKLIELEKSLDDPDIDDDTRFNLLMKQKTLRYIKYGEDSVEALYSHTSLGEYYTFAEMPESAIRHLKRAKELQTGKNIDKMVKARISICLAEAHLALSIKSNKELSAASARMKQVISADLSSDPQLQFRRDICNARILIEKEKYNESFEEYKKSETSLQACNPESDEGVATLYLEMGEAGRMAGKNDDAAPFYKKAYDIFMELEMEDEANEIEPYTHVKEADHKEEEEEENVEENVKEEEKEERKPSIQLGESSTKPE